MSPRLKKCAQDFNRLCSDGGPGSGPRPGGGKISLSDLEAERIRDKVRAGKSAGGWAKKTTEADLDRILAERRKSK